MGSDAPITTEHITCRQTKFESRLENLMLAPSSFITASQHVQEEVGKNELKVKDSQQEVDLKHVQDELF